MTTNSTYKPDWDELTAYVTGNISAAGARKVEAWIDSSTDNWKSFDKVRRTWLLARCTDLIGIDTEAAWDKVNEKAKIRPVPKIIKLSRLYIVRVAAVLVLGIVTWAVYNSIPHSKLIVATNKSIQLNLPDGSSVHLNRNALLKYPTKFANNVRNVELKGEAFFEITRNPQAPFIIKAQNTEIKVLGTSFNVGNTDGNLEVVVRSGRVTVTSMLTGENVILDSNEKALVAENGTLVKSINNNENYLAWKTKRFTFNQTRLDSVYLAVSKAYGFKVDTRDSSIFTHKLTATYENLQADTLIQVIDKTFGLESKKRGNTYRVSKMPN